MNGVKWSRISEQHDTIIIVCTGPSLKDFDFDNIKDKGYIIAVNDAGKYVPFADAWFTLDPWGVGTNGRQLPKKFDGTMYAAVPEDYALSHAKTTDHRVYSNSSLRYLHRIPFHTTPDIQPYEYLTWGLSEDTSCINTGNSGFGALNLAYHMNPKRIILLGLDASSGYFFDENKRTRSLNHLPLIFRSTVPQLKKKKIEVLNGSPTSNIDCFSRYTLPMIQKKLDSYAKIK